MKNFQYIPFLIIFFSLSSCEDVIDVDLPEAEKRMVVDSWLHNLSNNQVVKLSYTAPYFDSTSTPRVTEAVVNIYDDQGNIFNMIEEEPGVYRQNFMPQAGHSYSLEIITKEGAEYLSEPEIMASVPPLDDLYFEFRKREGFREEGYYIFIDFTDPAGVKNFYRWRYYINGELQNKPEHLIIETDELIDGSELREIQFNWDPLEEGDHVRIEQLSISEDAYNFLYVIREQLTSGRGTFDAPPAPVKGNIINKNNPNETVLGYFGVSEIDAREIVIEAAE